MLTRLLVVARVNHYFHAGKYWSYTPYVREIDLWADLFAEVEVAGTLRFETPPGDCTEFTRNNVTVTPISEADGSRWRDRPMQLILLPKIIHQLHKAMCRADAIHVRCPCDLGLLGIVMAPFYSTRLIAKYATQWLPYKGEPAMWSWQRALLCSKWWQGLVTVYGRWPNQPSKIIPFFTSVLTEEQIRRAQQVSDAIEPIDFLRILFVGRLSKSKNVDILLTALSLLKSTGQQFECCIVGEGPEQNRLEQLASDFGIRQSIQFTGGVNFQKVISLYEHSNVLVLASDVEGWPKAISEGMAFGLACIGTERGVVPQMLGERRGLLIPPRDAQSLHQALTWILKNPTETVAMRKRAAEWAQRYSMEGLRDALQKLMAETWESSGLVSPASLLPKESHWE